MAFTAVSAFRDQGALRCTHWFVGRGDFSRAFKEALCFCGRESLRGHRLFDAAASKSDESKDRHPLRIRHFRYDHKIVLAKREIQMDQLAASLLAKAGNRRLAVLGFCQPTLDVVARKTALCDEDRRLSWTLRAVRAAAWRRFDATEKTDRGILIRANGASDQGARTMTTRASAETVSMKRLPIGSATA